MENSYIISQYYCFYGIFDQMNVALESIREFPIPNFWMVVYFTKNIIC